MLPSDVFRRYLELVDNLSTGQLKSQLQHMHESRFRDRTPGLYSESSSALAQSVAVSVAVSHVYLVKSNMVDFVLKTADTGLVETTVVSSESPPQKCGVAFFEEPLHLTEVRGFDQLVHFVSWGPALSEEQR